ncbi:tyrosine-type recombinase/integrase [Pseudoxanthomonas mexicana]
MSQVIAFPIAQAAEQHHAGPTSSEIASFQERCLGEYRNRCKSRGLEQAYVEKCVRSVLDFLQWSQTTLATATEADYEAWSAYLAQERNLKSSTQRTYQKGVRQVFNLLVSRRAIQNEAVRLFGQRIELVAHRDNSIIHSSQDESHGERPPLTHDELDHLFASIEVAIDLAEVARPRALRALLRDNAVLYTGYVYGLRVSELIALTPNDWRQAPDMPELGKFGFLNVRKGKGAKGSGKRHRIVLTTHVEYPAFLQWYLAHVRPLYDKEAKANDPLFLNELGKRLSHSTIQKAFKRLIIAANLDPTRYSPHTLRRSMCQHQMMRAPTELARAQAGHKSASTTQIYGQVPEEHHRKISARLIRKQLQDMQGTEEA